MSNRLKKDKRKGKDYDEIPRFLREEMPFIVKQSDVMDVSAPSGASDPYPSMAKPRSTSPPPNHPDDSMDSISSDTHGNYSRSAGSYTASNGLLSTKVQPHHFSASNPPSSANTSIDGSNYYSAHSSFNDSYNYGHLSADESWEEQAPAPKSTRERMALNAPIYKPTGSSTPDSSINFLDSPRGAGSSFTSTPQHMKLLRKNQQGAYPDLPKSKKSPASSATATTSKGMRQGSADNILGTRNFSDPQVLASSSRKASDPTLLQTSRKASDSQALTKPTRKGSDTFLSVNSPISVSWNPSDAREWTQERVTTWLDYNKFGEDWIDFFHDHRINGSAFLSLSSYQSLKKLGLPSNRDHQDTRPSRFIHLLRRLLDKSTSSNSIEFEPHSSTNSNQQGIFSPDFQGKHSFESDHKDLFDPRNLGPFVFESSSNSQEGHTLEHNAKSFDNLSSVESESLRPRINRQLYHNRPMSTVEGLGPLPWNGPSSPVLKAGGAFLRRHRRASSSEFSQNMVSTGVADPLSLSTSSAPEEHISMSGTSVIPDSTNDRSARNIFSLNLLHPHVSGTKSKETPGFVHQSSNKDNLTLTLPEPSVEKYGFLPDSLRPIAPQNKGKYIMVTSNDEDFKIINITDVKSVEELKTILVTKMMIPRCELTLHVTEVGHKKGSMLDSNILNEILFTEYPSIETLKLFVSRRANVSTHSSGSACSESVEGAQPLYPATPAYLIHGNKSVPTDDESYFSLKKSTPTASASGSALLTTSSSSSTTLSSAGDGGQTASSPVTATPEISQPSSFRVIRREFSNSNDSFKVFRTKRKEINFDDRRSSPYDAKKPTNLVATREAPPPPKRESSVKLTRGFSMKQKTPQLKIDSSLAVPKDDTDSVKLYSPGQSENLIPRPYLGRKHMVVRKPVGGNSQAAPKSPSLKDGEESSEKFKENQISWEGAPAFVDESEDSEDSDSGLWAKKPPSSVTSSATGTLVAGNDSDSNSSVSKPNLKVETESLPGLSPVSPYKSAGSTFSPGVSEDVWAVRPSAEVVYDNLERFFPHTDLDKPIIDESAVNVQGAGNSSDGPNLSPVAERKESPTHQIKNDKAEPISPKSGSLVMTKMRPVQQQKQPSQPQATKKGAQAHRMKSIRVVAREASEARRKISKASAKDKIEGSALLRRKSTKLWGQKVVEMTPQDMEQGHLTKLRDQKGEYQQYFWVKGELIGKGTFGKVYLALNATTGEMMAVKQVEVPYTSSDKASLRQREVIEALHSEVETLKDLDHLNIVQYLGFEALNDVYSLFLEYVPGGSVGKILQMHGRLSEPIIKSLTRQVLEGLSYLHARGILHRDLKADNLLLDLDGICKISDFGISKKSRNIYANDAEMSMQGTIFWMAPEVIHNVVRNEKQGYSAKVDVWSLGCVVLEMFAGRRPWSTDEAIGAMYKLGTSRQAPPIPEDTKPYVSEIGKHFLEQCFEVNPDKRPTAQRLLEHEFSVEDPDFDFGKTDIAQKIRFNSRRKRRDRKS